MLKWEAPDGQGVRRAYDDHALYVIATNASGRFDVGYFPSPGPECVWKTDVETIAEAMAEGERCAARVRALCEVGR